MMCQDLFSEDLAKSRFRWYDFAALPLLHTPVRCQRCHRRYYAVKIGGQRLRLIPNLWMHLAILLVLIAAIVGILFPPANQLARTFLN